MNRYFGMMIGGWVVAYACGCQNNDPQPGTITQETLLVATNLVIPESGVYGQEFTAEAGRRVYIEVDSADALAEPDFRLILGDVDCTGEIPDGDVIIDGTDDVLPGEAQDSFEPTESGEYTVCFTDDNNAPGETTYGVLITQDIL